jgi:hypothetical protein
MGAIWKLHLLPVPDACDFLSREVRQHRRIETILDESAKVVAMPLPSRRNATIAHPAVRCG